MVVQNTYPVDLVQVIRLDDNAADDSSSRSSFQRDFGLSEEEVEVRLDGGRVKPLLDGELRAIGSSVDGSRGGPPSWEGGLGSSEVERVGRSLQTRIRGASSCGVISISLGSSKSGTAEVADILCLVGLQSEYV